MVYILDMVRALEREMLKRIHAQGLDMEPQIIVITRLIPEALGEQTSSKHVQGPQDLPCAQALGFPGITVFASMELLCMAVRRHAHASLSIKSAARA